MCQLQRRYIPAGNRRAHPYDFARLCAAYLLALQPALLCPHACALHLLSPSLLLSLLVLLSLVHLSEEACGNFECLWDDDSGKGCGPRFVSLFGHKIDLLEVKERQKDSGQAQDANVADRPEL